LPLDLENFQMRFGDYPDCGISAHGWKMSAIVNIHIYACRHVQVTTLLAHASSFYDAASGTKTR
jgi:hypothetical protein